MVLGGRAEEIAASAHSIMLMMTDQQLALPKTKTLCLPAVKASRVLRNSPEAAAAAAADAAALPGAAEAAVAAAAEADPPLLATEAAAEAAAALPATDTDDDGCLRQAPAISQPGNCCVSAMASAASSCLAAVWC